MSQLVQIRQRIKTIATIKKITHAMRLIAMSTHGRLKKNQESVRRYTQEIERLFQTVHQLLTPWHFPLQESENAKTLYIIVGSQKGLCGTFNATILNACKEQITNPALSEVITVGKRIQELLTQKYVITPLQIFDTLHVNTYLSISQEIAHHIISTPYKKVILMSMVAKSFFSQIVRKTELLPLNPLPHPSNEDTYEEYVWEEKPEDFLSGVLEQYITARIQTALYESIIAEQAARFLSMDGSTRNASNLLEATQLQYNKLRQANITKELIELNSL